MTNIEYTNWLERMIEGCDDLKGMEREKAIYQNCLKKARALGQKLPIQRVSNPVCRTCNGTGLVYIDEVIKNTLCPDC